MRLTNPQSHCGERKVRPTSNPLKAQRYSGTDFEYSDSAHPRSLLRILNLEKSLFNPRVSDSRRLSNGVDVTSHLEI